jgi:hypothetical protein
MPAIGLVVEGEFDIAVLEVLIPKILGHPVQLKHRFGPGQGGVVQFFPVLLSDIAAEGQINKAIVVADRGKRRHVSSGQLKTGMETRLQDCQFVFPVHIVIVSRELEAWLLADEMVLSEMTKQSVPAFGDLENLLNPKTELVKILAQAKPEIPYTASIARAIAEKMRLEILWNRCNSFRDFRDAVLAA